jgi:hypothetical protein
VLNSLIEGLDGSYCQRRSVRKRKRTSSRQDLQVLIKRRSVSKYIISSPIYLLKSLTRNTMG